MEAKPENNRSLIRTGIRQGLAKGWSGFTWLLKILVPISFATALFVHFGVIHKLDFLFAPVMQWLSLPASAALVLMIGMFTGIYGTVAALSVMPFAMEQMILIAVFTLISHNLIQESLVQANSGINFFFAAFFRLFMAFVVTFACSLILGATPDTGGIQASGQMQTATVPFTRMALQWGVDTGKLVIQIFCILMPLMVILELFKRFKIIAAVTRLTAPVLKLMGLDRSCGMLWLTASIFGLAYGAAVMVEETQSHEYDKEDLTKLHLSIGVNHAMIEDPALFLPLGLPPFWLWIPRLAAAVLTVWLYTLYLSARRYYAQRAGHKKLCNH